MGWKPGEHAPFLISALVRPATLPGAPAPVTSRENEADIFTDPRIQRIVPIEED